MIESFFASGYVADLVLVVMAVEVVVLFTLMRRGIIGIAFRTYLFGVVAGGCIVLALRLALTGGQWPLIALALAFSFAAHIVEVLTFVRRNNGDPIYRDPSYMFRSETQTGSKKGLEQ